MSRALAAGALHTVAVDGSGVVRAWGEGGSQQLGTGSTTDQTSPTIIWTAPGRWSAPPPTISLVSGTYTTDQTAVVADAVSGTVIRYTTNGADPTDSDTQVPENGEVCDHAIHDVQGPRLPDRSAAQRGGVGGLRAASRVTDDCAGGRTIRRPRRP